MKSISLAELKQLPVQSYDALRASLRTGDLMLASGDYLLSQTIRRVTRSPWSHVGVLVVLQEFDRVLLMEAVEGAGVRLVPLSKYINDYDDKGGAYRGHMVLARINDLKAEHIPKIIQFGFSELGRPFDTEQLFNAAARMMLGLPNESRDRAYVCSELIEECFLHAGRPFSDHGDGFVAPEDIWIDPQVQLIGRVL